MRCLVLLAFVSAALAAALPLERRRIGRKNTPWVRKLLVVRSAEDAEPWAKHASAFKVSLNYNSKTHGDDQTRLLPDVLYAPMQQVDDDLATWTAQAEAAIKNGAQYLLGLKCVARALSLADCPASRTRSAFRAPQPPRSTAERSRPCCANTRTSKASRRHARATPTSSRCVAVS